MNFVKSSLKYPQVTVSILLITFIAGVYSLVYMPRREDPKIEVREGQIIALYPGANSAQVEDQVTKKLEQYLFQFEEVRRERTNSTTRDGVAVIDVWLNQNVKNSDIFWSKLRHQLLVAKAVDLPQGVKGLFVNSDFGDTEALVIGISMQQPDYEQLREHAQRVEDSLRTIKAVSKVKRIGEQRQQIIIALDSARLEQYGITFAKVMQVLQSQNAISASGDVKTPEAKVTIYSNSYFKTENDIGSQIVGASRTGEVIRIKDIAEIRRQYQDPDSKVFVNGEYAILLAVQMQEGCNIVEFGAAVDRKLAEIATQLPGDVKMLTVVNQPEIVKENVGHFIFEFFLAIIAVVIVIVFLLPLRVAAVAATAIPMTISATFALLHILGIELHQVSLAALIVVLGMVVDDAVVIADNYVDLLDKGVDRKTAAWRSASDLVVPVLTATLTIIAAFLPIVLVSGPVGEFIIALPITVSIALAASFIVAMVLTPLLCLVFIKKGLYGDSEKAAPAKLSPLNLMQRGYDTVIVWCMSHHKITIAVCLSSFLAALALFQFVPQKFFPAAERNQFLIYIWMPTGTKLERTESAVLGIQDLIRDDKRVVSYATFVGTSAPRFYYNFSPEPPVSNFGQILVNTRTKKEAEQMHDELSAKVDGAAPEARTQVKLLQQGTPMVSPIEIRIKGEEIDTLKEIGAQVQDILNQTGTAKLVRSDFMEDYYGVNVSLKDNAERLGFTTSSIAGSIHSGFSGVLSSIMYEGDSPVDIMVRLDERRRQSFRDLEDMYVTSPVTGAGVPLRQIAVLEPQWHHGRIMHRNGLRTLTILCEPGKNFLASQILEEITPELKGISLPLGYNISYGGEYEDQRETFSELKLALCISMLLIFLVLLIQFRNLKETFLVMLTVPLSLFGALLGLIITGNNFGFTAFVGLISLSGIVVRHAIILIDYTNELLGKGFDVPNAALEAGKRRLRPIFLTASAAAIGVIPMIISGSSLWSPLASVISVGVMLSMVISLLLVPVLYAQMTSLKKGAATLLSIALLILVAPGVQAQEAVERLSLQEAIDLATQNNHLLKIKKLQVNERQQKIYEDRVKYFPTVSLDTSYFYNSNAADLTVPQGSFGQVPLGGTSLSLPARDQKMELVGHDVYIAAATIYQPISQIPKITHGVRLSETDLQIANAEQAKAALQVKQSAERLYFGLLILFKQKEESEIKLTLAKKKLDEIEGALLAGKTTLSNKIGLTANVADEEQNLLKINIQIDDLMADLKHVTGVPEKSTIELVPVSLDVQPKVQPLKAYLDAAKTGNNDLRMAELNKTRTEHAIKASGYSYLPDFGLVGGYAYQSGSTLFPTNNSFVGVSFRWNLLDLVSNSYVRNQRVYLKKQAEENMLNTSKQVNIEIEKSYRKLMHSAELISVAGKVYEYRKEDFKIQRDRRDAGLNLESDLLTAKAALSKAEGDLYAAQLNYRIALSNLRILTGRFEDL